VITVEVGTPSEADKGVSVAADEKILVSEADSN
jgi:hypothetical protein